MMSLMMLLTLLIMVEEPAKTSSSPFPAWMSGSWRMVAEGTVTEEHWSKPGGTVMVGMNRTIRPNGKTSFEFLRIEKRGDSLAYVAQPGGAPATSFLLKEATNNRITFENLQHDFPQRVIYWREEKRLCARVEGMIKGKLESEQWCWARMP